MLKGRSKETTLEQKSSVNALGVVNIGGVFVVLLVGLAFAVMVAIGAEFVVPFSFSFQIINFLKWKHHYLIEDIIIWLKTSLFHWNHHYLIENIIIWFKTHFTQMMIFSPNNSFWTKEGFIWFESERTRVRGKRDHKFRAIAEFCVKTRSNK